MSPKGKKSGDEPAVEPEVVLDEELSPERTGLAADTAAPTIDPDLKPDGKPPGESLPVLADDSSTALVPRDALSQYMSEIRRYPILTREEEHDLAVKFVEEGDTDAAYKLVTSNLRLVVMIAREYQRAFHNLLDLVQEGNVGLMEAVQKFDPYRGVRLPSYAVWWIRAYIIRYVMNNFRMVKVGTTQAQRRLFFNLQKEKARLEAEGFTPTPGVIAKNLGVKESEVVEMDKRMHAGSEVSADAPVGPEGDTAMLDLISYDSTTAEDQFADRELFSMIRDKLGKFGEDLEGREKEIFDDRLLSEDPVTLQDLGERFGVSRERVRQIEEALKKRLREFLVEEVRISPEEVVD